jgi:hypothetical protein
LGFTIFTATSVNGAATAMVTVGTRDQKLKIRNAREHTTSLPYESSGEAAGSVMPLSAGLLLAAPRNQEHGIEYTGFDLFANLVNPISAGNRYCTDHDFWSK